MNCMNECMNLKTQNTSFTKCFFAFIFKPLKVGKMAFLKAFKKVHCRKNVWILKVIKFFRYSRRENLNPHTEIEHGNSTYHQPYN